MAKRKVGSMERSRIERTVGPGTARRRELGITAAITTAINEASAHERSAGDELALKIEPILSQIRKLRVDGVADSEKVFMDEMWGEADDAG